MVSPYPAGQFLLKTNGKNILSRERSVKLTVSVIPAVQVICRELGQ